MDPDAYADALALPPPNSGGQELILGEIIAAIHPLKKVWVPFYSSGTLVARLRETKHRVWANKLRDDYGLMRLPPAEVVYFGTPTIVDGKALFPAREVWDKEKERRVVRGLVARCAAQGYSRVVCGLGSGDISVEERLSDLGGGSVVAEKHFEGFIDWVIVQDLAVTAESAAKEERAITTEGTEPDERM